MLKQEEMAIDNEDPPMHEPNSSITTTVSFSDGFFSHNSIPSGEVNQLVHVQPAIPPPLVGLGVGLANLMEAYPEEDLDMHAAGDELPIIAEALISVAQEEPPSGSDVAVVSVLAATIVMNSEAVPENGAMLLAPQGIVAPDAHVEAYLSAASFQSAADVPVIQSRDVAHTVEDVVRTEEAAAPTAHVGDEDVSAPSAVLGGPSSKTSAPNGEFSHQVWHDGLNDHTNLPARVLRFYVCKIFNLWLPPPWIM